MKKKIVWVVLGSLVALSLILAACAPKAPTAPTTPAAPAVPTAPTAPTAPTTKEKVTLGKEMVTNSVGKLVEKPQFGGTLTIAINVPVPGFDQHVNSNSLKTVWVDQLMVGDWSRGMAGSGETHFVSSVAPEWWMRFAVGELATKWELPDPTTILFYIHPGARFQNNPVNPLNPANGLEVTAEDVVYSSWKNFTSPLSYAAIVWPYRLIDAAAVVDRYTAKFTVQKHLQILSLSQIGLWNPIQPKAAMEKYGNLNDWRNAVGSGPFMFEDVVPGASYSFVRNSNYWRKQPLYPQDTQPYVDRLKILVIPDRATMQAAFRARKIDQLPTLTWEDLKQLQKSTPDLKYYKDWQANTPVIGMVVDNPKLPWYDKKVRQALQMAINREDIRDSLYEGEAEIYQWPVMPAPALSKLFTPMNELPQSVQELFKYQPAKAKQLLAEAGYPNGFKAKIITRAIDIDLLAVVKEYWKAIGVDLEIQVKEPGVYTSILAAQNQEEMVMGISGSGGVAVKAMAWQSVKGWGNYPRMNVPEQVECVVNILANPEDIDIIAQAWRKYTPFLLDYAAFVALPTPYSYTMWQPWVKDYHGEFRITQGSQFDWARYLWIDQDLKQSLTGRR